MANDKPDKLDMDIINMVQNARMMHDDDAVPSKVPGVYWIESKNPDPDVTPTANAGEFHINTRVDIVDEQWATIKAATEAGELGYKSKVSTSPTDGTPHGKQRLIVVRTVDASDTTDVRRVEAYLRDMGFTDLSYSVINQNK